MRRKILYIGDADLKNPVRGTPLRIYNFLRQIRKEHDLTIVARDVEDDLRDLLVPYPKIAKFSKLIFFRRLVRERRVEIIFIATEQNIKLPIILKFLTGVKIVIDLHGLRAEERLFFGRIGIVRKTFYDKIIKYYLLFYDLVFTVTGKLRSYFLKYNSNIAVIYGGFNPEEFRILPKNVDNKIFIIGYMGNSRNYQGLDYILEAAGQIKKKKTFDFRLNLIVSGDKEYLLAALKKYDLDGVTDLIFDATHDKVNEIISKSDVLAIPRPSMPVTEYAYPAKLPEYLATGIPLILSNVGPVGELLKGQSFCIIIGTDAISIDLEKALEKVYSMEENQRQKMGKAAFEFVQKNLSWDVLGHKINEHLEAL